MMPFAIQVAQFQLVILAQFKLVTYSRTGPQPEVCSSDGCISPWLWSGSLPAAGLRQYESWGHGTQTAGLEAGAGGMETEARHRPPRSRETDKRRLTGNAVRGYGACIQCH